MTKEYLRSLKEEVGKYAGALRDVVLLTPSYAMLMLRMLNDPRLSRRHRLWVDAAIAYLVSADDVIPEDEFGGYGYLDDLFCCAYVATRIGEEAGWDVVEESWRGAGSAHEMSHSLVAREQELLGHTVGDDVLRFAGLRDRSEDEPDAAWLAGGGGEGVGAWA